MRFKQTSVYDKQGNIQQESLVFNIIYIPGMTKYLEPFVSSLLNSTNCKFRLIANGCFKDEQLLLEKYCNENPRLEYFLISSNDIITHCKALTILQEKEASDYFCFMDADIFSRGPFLDDLLTSLKDHSAVFSAYPIWCDAHYQEITDDWPKISGRHIISRDGICLGGSFFAIYDNQVLKQFIQSTGITFSRYSWPQIPSQYQDKLIDLGLKKNTYDTAKVLNILIQEQGHSLLFMESESLFHLGAMTEFFTGKIDRLFKGKLPGFVSLQQNHFRKLARVIKRRLQKVLGAGSSGMPEQEDAGYRQMLKTRETVSSYFLELLMAVSSNRPFNKKLDISNPEIERRVKLATEGIKSIWKESGIKPQKSQLLSSMLLFLASTVFGFVLIEALFRFYVFGTNSFSVEKLNSTRPLGVSGLVSPAIFPELIYELKPNLKTTFKMVPFETNSVGLRDKEYTLSATKNTFRVAVLSDSLIMGSGVDIDETFHSLLEDRFNKEQTERTSNLLISVWEDTHSGNIWEPSKARPVCINQIWY